ncbi:hypothetical protein Kpol_1050p66 [Vanderwaltozyma polyspora DSM 70294]|uniref:Uncharacterized protein n=1 Tax=Vanderwaltozyma polyspora (strain ATCC 22028 / DSM 70294 / BCRC 21397 / CBS 2163 / NBRC 10782 / NRRL Y-8283 / UCD 57-17) TaxID=436907 RepID=A7TEW2_VANPO|nr:uncharacterized protein Kpol_1050p66 [Vanderwaltozyma polyspora DSM 70294]EDO19208.1 hypothetical protein Kpol_1050p66 [Vanderwaltozyma polyspora DSM 70294]
MKLNSEVFKEAQLAARAPRFRYLILGLVCGAVVPTIYMRRYIATRPSKESLQDINAIKEQARAIEEGSKLLDFDVTSTREMLNVPLASWHLNGNTKYITDEKFRSMVDDNSMILFSSMV